MEQEDRAAAGVIRERRVNGEQEDRAAAAWNKERKKSKETHDRAATWCNKRNNIDPGIVYGRLLCFLNLKL